MGNFSDLQVSSFHSPSENMAFELSAVHVMHMCYCWWWFFCCF